jgi:hypothetical protein
MENQGHHGDFAEVMLPHLDAAYNLARWLVRDPSLAEDVVQDAYERACRYFSAFRGGSGRAWLLQIVRNVAYSTLKARRQRMEVSLSSEMHAADEDGVDMDIPDSTRSRGGGNRARSWRRGTGAQRSSWSHGGLSHPARSGGAFLRGDGAMMQRSIGRSSRLARATRAPAKPISRAGSTVYRNKSACIGVLNNDKRLAET